MHVWSSLRVCGRMHVRDDMRVGGAVHIRSRMTRQSTSSSFGAIHKSGGSIVVRGALLIVDCVARDRCVCRDVSGLQLKSFIRDLAKTEQMEEEENRLG